MSKKKASSVSTKMRPGVQLKMATNKKSWVSKKMVVLMRCWFLNFGLSEVVIVVKSDSELTALQIRSRYMTICYKKSMIFLISSNSHFRKNSMNTKIKDLQW